MALACSKRRRTPEREVSVAQIELDLGLDHDESTPRMSFPLTVHEALVRLMAQAILAVHQAARQEASDDGARDRES
jgi:hypothetical protein